MRKIQGNQFLASRFEQAIDSIVMQGQTFPEEAFRSLDDTWMVIVRTGRSERDRRSELGLPYRTFEKARLADAEAYARSAKANGLEVVFHRVPAKYFESPAIGSLGTFQKDSTIVIELQHASKSLWDGFIQGSGTGARRRRDWPHFATLVYSFFSKVPSVTLYDSLRGRAMLAGLSRSISQLHLIGTDLAETVPHDVIVRFSLGANDGSISLDDCRGLTAFA